MLDTRGVLAVVCTRALRMGENRRVPVTPTSPEATPRASDGLDAVCAAAVPAAQAAARDVADPGTVGEHLGAVAEGQRVVTHFFACTAKGYRGWRWSVSVARAPRARHATVSEVVLIPGPESVLPPVWVPWAERIAPGDLGAADALPYRADDPYLEAGFAPATDGDTTGGEALGWELGLGRARVLSPEGRDAAATRWYLGDRGPAAAEAVNATAACTSCGYWLPLAGGLRQLFGVCANEWSPSDGRVVSLDHGCGAHSETDVERPEPQALPVPVLDETVHEAVVLAPRTAAPAVAEAPVEGGAPVEDTPDENATPQP